MNTPTRNHEPALLVDPGAGVLLDAPPNPIVTARYVENHPFVVQVRRGGNTYILAGPDAPKAAEGDTNVDDYVTYLQLREVAGALHLQRVS